MFIKTEDAQMWNELGLLREEMDSPDLNRELLWACRVQRRQVSQMK